MICIIPAKGASSRLPRKNLLPLGGHPLVGHSIRKAAATSLFGVICVSTEDEELAETARSYGADVPFMRPEYLSRDPATIVDVVLHAVEFYAQKGRGFDQVCVLLPTTPFVTVQDIRDGYSIYMRCGEEGLLSVTRAEFPPFNAWLIDDKTGDPRLKPCFPDSPYKSMKSTECPKAYRSNGAFLFTNLTTLRAHRNYYRSAPVPFVMPQSRSIDIDTDFEYRVACALWEAEGAQIAKEIFT